SRWQRSRSRERCPAGTVLSLAPGHDSSGTDYAADQSSEHSTPANSPRRGKKGALQRFVSSFSEACFTTWLNEGYSYVPQSKGTISGGEIWNHRELFYQFKEKLLKDLLKLSGSIFIP
ncbi:jg1550, partial [Pararge aegeria aegeria]